MLYAIGAVLLRNFQLLSRQKSLVVQPILLPLAVMLLASFIFGGGGKGDAYSIALINDSHSSSGERIEQTIMQLRSNISPYFDVIEKDLEKAKSMVETGRLQMAIHIPESFESNGSLEVYTYNINSDAMKNLRLRLEYAINEIAPGSLRLDMHLEKPHDVWRSAFIGGSSVIMALFFGATLIAANLFAYEWENRTRKEMLLTPIGSLAAGWGALIAAVAVSMVTSLPTLAVALWLFKLEVPFGIWLIVYLHMIPIMIGCAGIGIWIASRLKQYRSIQPVIVLTAMATFFVGGGFISVVVLPPLAQGFAKWWVFSRIFEWFNPVLHQFANGFTGEQYIWFTIAALVGVFMMVWSYQSERRQPLDGGQ